MKWNEVSSFCCSKYQQRYIEMSDVFRSWPRFKAFSLGRAGAPKPISFLLQGQGGGKVTPANSRRCCSNSERAMKSNTLDFGESLVLNHSWPEGADTPALTVSMWVCGCVCIGVFVSMCVCVCVSSLHRNLQNKAWVGRLSWSQLKQL